MYFCCVRALAKCHDQFENELQLFMSYVEEIQIHTGSLCDSLFITRWFFSTYEFPKEMWSQIFTCHVKD